MCVIIIRSLYAFYLIFDRQKRFLRRFFVKYWPYVQLVFKSSFKSGAIYNGARTIYILKIHILCTDKMSNLHQNMYLVATSYKKSPYIIF